MIGSLVEVVIGGITLVGISGILFRILATYVTRRDMEQYVSTVLALFDKNMGSQLDAINKQLTTLNETLKEITKIVPKDKL